MDEELLVQVESDVARVGERLRRLRKERDWRLEDLAERTGLSQPYLSRIESGERQPSLAVLFGVARALGVPYASLVEPEVEDRVVVRGGSALVQRGNGLLYTPLSGGNGAFGLQPLRIVVPAEREGDKLYRHEGEEWLYVLSGRLLLRLADEEYELEAGDAAHFDATRPHRLGAMGGEDAEVILVAGSSPQSLVRSYL